MTVPMKHVRLWTSSELPVVLEIVGVSLVEWHTSALLSCTLANPPSVEILKWLPSAAVERGPTSMSLVELFSKWIKQTTNENGWKPVVQKCCHLFCVAGKGPSKENSLSLDIDCSTLLVSHGGLTIHYLEGSALPMQENLWIEARAALQECLLHIAHVHALKLFLLSEPSTPANLSASLQLFNTISLAFWSSPPFEPSFHHRFLLLEALDKTFGLSTCRDALWKQINGVRKTLVLMVVEERFIESQRAGLMQLKEERLRKRLTGQKVKRKHCFDMLYGALAATVTPFVIITGAFGMNNTDTPVETPWGWMLGASALFSIFICGFFAFLFWLLGRRVRQMEEEDAEYLDHQISRAQRKAQPRFGEFDQMDAFLSDLSPCSDELKGMGEDIPFRSSVSIDLPRLPQNSRK